MPPLQQANAARAPRLEVLCKLPPALRAGARLLHDPPQRGLDLAEGALAREALHAR